MEDSDKQPVCRDASYEEHFTPARVEALNKWRGQDKAPVTSGALFTGDYLGPDEALRWQQSTGTSKA